jgi:hypothetical protein
MIAALSVAIACRREPSASRDATTTPEKPDPPPLAASPRAPIDAAPDARHWTFDSPRAALEHVLAETRPRVLGVGESHKLTGSAPVVSALHRFTNDMVGALEGRATDLVVETWVLEPRCKEPARRAQREVATAIQRPAETENELVALLERARSARMAPHVLPMSCADHESLYSSGGADIDYWKLLVLVGRRLGDQVGRALAQHRGSEPLVVVYGGAQHNDLYPYDSLAEVSYAAAVDRLSEGRYAELDLYVPELIRGDELLRGEGWFPLFESMGSSDRELLIERAPRSYILILRSGLAAKPPKHQPNAPSSAR